MEYNHKVIISFKTNIINTQKFSPVYLIFILTAQLISTTFILFTRRKHTFFHNSHVSLFVHIFPNKTLSIMRMEGFQFHFYLHIYFIKSTLIFSSRFLRSGKWIFQSLHFPTFPTSWELCVLLPFFCYTKMTFSFIVFSSVELQPSRD